MSDRHKILIIGNKLHGKTTFARFLVDHLGKAECFSTSSYLIYRLSLITGASQDEILRDKETFRPQLVKLGNAMCDVDPGCLVSICLWSSTQPITIIDGVRRISEYDNVKAWFEHIFWIERPKQELGLDNLELTTAHAHHTILNDGSLEDLNASAKAWSEKIRNSD